MGLADLERELEAADSLSKKPVGHVEACLRRVGVGHTEPVSERPEEDCSAKTEGGSNTDGGADFGQRRGAANLIFSRHAGWHHPRTTAPRFSSHYVRYCDGWVPWSPS